MMHFTDLQVRERESSVFVFCVRGIGRKRHTRTERDCERVKDNYFSYDSLCRLRYAHNLQVIAWISLLLAKKIVICF